MLKLAVITWYLTVPFRFIVIKELSVKIQVILEPSEEGGFTVHVPSLPGCISEGDNREEALANIKEAITLYLEPIENDVLVAPNAQLFEIAI